MPVRAWPFEILLLWVILVFGCAPAVQRHRQVVGKTPSDIWQTYCSIFEHSDGFRRLAIDYDARIGLAKVFDCRLQMVYLYPDSFAFAVKSLAGVVIARGVTIGSTGFYEYPRDRLHVELTEDGYIEFNPPGERLCFGQVLSAIFFFREGFEFQDAAPTKRGFYYTCHRESVLCVLELDGETALPVCKKVYGPCGEYLVSYEGWRRLGGLVYPGRIVVDGDGGKTKVTLKTRRLKSDPRVPAKFFLPMWQ